PVVVEPVDRRVVGRREADQQVVRLDRREPLQERFEAGGGVLGGAASRTGEIRELDLHAVNASAHEAGGDGGGGGHHRRRLGRGGALRIPHCRFVALRN